MFKENQLSFLLLLFINLLLTDSENDMFSITVVASHFKFKCAVEIQ